MKRDMELVRQMLLATEAQAAGKPITSMEGVEYMDFVQHVIWLQQAGLITGHAALGLNPPKSAHAFIQGLTWNGCEFVDAMRDDTLWAKAKAKFMRPGISFTLDIVKDWLKAEITQGLPTLGG